MQVAVTVAPSGWNSMCGRGVSPSRAESLLWVCAVVRRRFPVGASPTRRSLQPEATGAVMEVTKCG